MVQGIGEVEPAAHTGYGLLQGWPVFRCEAGMGQQVVEHLQHLLHREAVVPTQHPLQLQGHRLGQEKRLAGFDQIAGGPALAFRARIGFVLRHEVAGQDIGVHANHGRSRLAGSKSAGTAGRLDLSNPNPLSGSGCSGFQGRSSM